MQYLGIEYNMKHTPKLDQQFIPFGVWRTAYLKDAKKPIAIAVERDKGRVSVHHTCIHGTPEMAEADYRYVERYVKFLLWSIGGFRVSVCGCSELAQRLKKAYDPKGERHFDFTFFNQLYERDLEIVDLPLEDCPAANEVAEPIGGNLDGCRIGFDAGGSDRKVSAVLDGEPIYSEEVVWFPKTISNPDYHFEGIMAALSTAAAKILEKGGHVDAIGVSSAGVYIDNKCMVASLFLKVGKDEFDKKVKNIYTRAAEQLSSQLGYHIPVVVANDGDVSALAGAMGLGENGIMGIAMGTSEAVGYVDTEGNICGWLNELAFAPVDGQPDAMEDEWSGDIGCGVKYFSQDGVIKLAPRAGIELTGASPAEKLKEVQALMAADDARAKAVYESIGVYLGHTLGLYAMFYDIRHVQMMGRVMSGKGGDIIMETASRVMDEEYPDVAFRPEAPDEKTRRVGQSAAAASLPELK